MYRVVYNGAGLVKGGRADDEVLSGLTLGVITIVMRINR